METTEQRTSGPDADRPRGLAQRECDGLHVALIWFEQSNRLVVCVRDERSGDYCELAAEAANALDVFHHPFAYAARQGIPYRVHRRERELELAAAA